MRTQKNETILQLQGSGQGDSYGRVQTFHGRPVGTHGLLKFLVSKMEQFFESPRTILSTTRKEMTCSAAPGVRCELGTGQPRTEPHRDRRLIAAEKSG